MTANLDVDRMETLAADDLILEVEADGPRLDRKANGLGNRLRRDAVAAFEVHRDRQVDRLDDAADVLQRQGARDLLAIRETKGGGHRPASGRDRLRTGAGDDLRRTRIPDVEQHDGIALHVQGVEGLGVFGLRGHVIVPPMVSVTVTASTGRHSPR